jgi:hypothetical protein
VPRIKGPNRATEFPWDEEGLSPGPPMPIGIAQEHETKKRAAVRARMDDSGRITPEWICEQTLVAKRAGSDRIVYVLRSCKCYMTYYESILRNEQVRVGVHTVWHFSSDS